MGILEGDRVVVAAEQDIMVEGRVQAVEVPDKELVGRARVEEV